MRKPVRKACGQISGRKRIPAGAFASGGFCCFEMCIRDRDNVFEGKSAVIENLLYTGAYILAGAPKIGKSFLVAQIAHHVSTGQDLWDCKVHQGTVLYLALEDDESRLQRRMFRMFGVEVEQARKVVEGTKYDYAVIENDNLYLSNDNQYIKTTPLTTDVYKRQWY